MVRRNIIPRRLIGAHGVKLYDIQGLKYPVELLQEEPEEDVADAPPAWGISTAEAAEILGCRPSSARDVMDKLEVRKQKVRREGLPPTWYWDKRQVETVAAARRDELRNIPARYMSAHEVSIYLGISRSTLFRYVRAGLLIAYSVRHRSEHGLRIKQFFLRDDVRRLRYHLNALRQRCSGAEPYEL
ncbi:MAG: hypothetical protein IKZ10_03720 [Akkermansia sp.]|nr:hypothetical protein [Akkermansia sp.]